MPNPLFASMSCPASRCIVSLCDNFHLNGQFRFQRLGRADQLKAWNPDDRSNLLQEVRFQLEPLNRNPSCRSQKPWRLVHYTTLINYKNYVFCKYSCLSHLLLTMLSKSPRPNTTCSHLALFAQWTVYCIEGSGGRVPGSIIGNIGTPIGTIQWTKPRQMSIVGNTNQVDLFRIFYTMSNVLWNMSQPLRNQHKLEVKAIF